MKRKKVLCQNCLGWKDRRAKVCRKCYLKGKREAYQWKVNHER